MIVGLTERREHIGQRANRHRTSEQLATVDTRPERGECRRANGGGDTERRDQQPGLFDRHRERHRNVAEQAAHAQKAGGDEEIAGDEDEQALGRHGTTDRLTAERLFALAAVLRSVD
jgi:hypothetical protein